MITYYCYMLSELTTKPKNSFETIHYFKDDLHGSDYSLVILGVIHGSPGLIPVCHGVVHMWSLS